MDYEKYQRQQIIELGFKNYSLTQSQIDILLQPINAPEDYHHDGEVTPERALQIWKGDMTLAGFTREEIFKAKLKMGI